MITYRVNSPVFVGALEPSVAGSSSAPTGATRSSIPSAPTQGIGTAANVSVPCPEGDTAPISVGNVRGVNVAALSEAIASMESSSSYDAIGPYICADGGRNCGMALGKYQFVTYNEYAASAIAPKPGGQQFLAKVKGGYQPTQAELFQFFPAADQEAAFQRSISDKIDTTTQEIDPTTGTQFSGERLIERVAQKHFGGDYSKVDGGATDAFGRLTLKSYSSDILKRYQAGSGAIARLSAAACTPTASTDPLLWS